MAADLARLAAAFSWGQDSPPEDDGGGQEDGRAADVGAVVVAGCKTPPVLQAGKERLDFVTPAIQPLVVMDWLLAAVAGWVQGVMPCWTSILRIVLLSYP